MDQSLRKFAGCIGWRDARSSREFCELAVRHHGIVNAGVTPPVVPQYNYEFSEDVPYGPIGRVEPWRGEEEWAERDLVRSGRSYHSRLQDAELMMSDDDQ